MHGYNITQKVKEMTEGQVEIGPGTTEITPELL